MFRLPWQKPLKLGVSMSGGGAKSLIYLGVLKALEENGIKPAVVGGLSGGAMISGAYAAGLSVDKIEEIATGLNFKQLLDTNPADGWSILDRDKLYNFIKSIVGDKKIEDCAPKVIIFATDFDTKKLHVFTEGELAEAIVASCGLPPLLKPTVIDGHRLGEGGFTIHYGAKHFHQAGADKVLGVNVEGFGHTKFTGIVHDFVDGAYSLIRTNAAFEQQIDPVDIRIENIEDDTGMFEFRKISSKLIKIGFDHIQDLMPEIKKILRF